MKLPEINYGSKVEGLGRYKSRAPSIIQKTGQVKGEATERAGKILSGAMLTAGTIRADSKKKTGLMVAEGELAAQKMKNDGLAKKATDEARLESYQDGVMANAWLGIATDMAQIAVQSGVRMYEASQEAKKEQGAASYKNTMKVARAKLQAGPSIDLTQFPEAADLDIDPNDITVMRNPDGSISQMVPTHLVSGELYNKIASIAKEKALEEISNAAHREELELKMDNVDAEHTTSLIATNAAFDRDYTSAGFDAAHDNFIRAGDPIGMEKAARAAEVRGVWTSTKAQKQIRTGKDQIKYDKIQGMIRDMTSVSQLEGLSSQVENADLPSSMKNSLFVDIKVERNRLESEAKRINAERTEKNAKMELIRKADEVAASDLTPKQKRDEYLKFIEENDYGKYAITAMNNLDSTINRLEHDYAQDQKDSFWAEFYNPDSPLPDVPAEADGDERRRMETARELRLKGQDVVTDKKLYFDLKDAATEVPEKFANIDIRSKYGGRLGTRELNELRAIQGEIKAGRTPKSTSEYATLKGQIDGMAKQVFGVQWNKSDKKIEAVTNLTYAANQAILDAEQDAGRKLRYNERQDIVTEIFKGEITLQQKAILGGTKDVGYDMDDPEVTMNMPAIVRKLRRKDMEINSENIQAEMQEMYLRGEL